MRDASRKRYPQCIDDDSKTEEADNNVEHSMVYVSTNEIVAVIFPILVGLGFIRKFAQRDDSESCSKESLGSAEDGTSYGRAGLGRRGESDLRVSYESCRSQASGGRM